MMLWFALLLLLIRAPGSEARLLPEDQLRAAKGLCEGKEAVSDSLLSSAAALFVSRSLLTGSDQLLGDVNYPNVQKAKEYRQVSDKELLNELASIQAPSGGDHLVVENHPASFLTNGDNLVVQQHDTKNRVPPVHTSTENELLTNLASTNSVPSGGDHRLTVEKKNRAPPSFNFESLKSVPSGGDHLVVEKRNRSPPSFTSASQTLTDLGKGPAVSGPSTTNYPTVVEKKNGGPPSFKFESLVSVPSGGNHLVVEKKKRSPPSFTSHRVKEQGDLEEAKKTSRSPAEVDIESEHVTVDRKGGLKNREILMDLASKPSAERFQNLDSAPSDLNHLVVENERNTSPPAGSATDSDQVELKDFTRQRSPPADHEHKATEHTDSESSVDTSQKVGCSDTIWDSFDYMAQQFANSVRRISVYS